MIKINSIVSKLARVFYGLPAVSLILLTMYGLINGILSVNISNIISAIYFLSIGSLVLLWLSNRSIPFALYVAIVSVFIIGTIFTICSMLLIIGLSLDMSRSNGISLDGLFSLFLICMLFLLIIKDIMIIKKGQINTY